MIISGLQTGNTRWLAAHLQNAADNESIEIAEITGAVAQDIDGALAEFDAITAGTRATEGVYAAFINPPLPLTRAQCMRAIDVIAERLGLTGQPRIVLFHTKEGRHHCHVVWSRIDLENMKAIHLAHDRQKLRRCAQELAAEFGFDLPPGLKEDVGSARFERPKRPTKAEKAMAEKSGLTVAGRRAAITACYRQADSAEAFINALEAAGYMLARGDKRCFVVVDIAGDVHSLARQIEGARMRDVKARLEGLELSRLPPVERAQAEMARRAQAQCEAARAAATRRGEAEEKTEKLKAIQKERRSKLDLLWQQMKVRQMHEWKVLLAHVKAEEERHLRRHWTQIGLARYLRKIAVIRQLLEYYAERKKRSLEDCHQQLKASLRRRHENEQRELARQYEALLRLVRREWAAPVFTGYLGAAGAGSGQPIRFTLGEGQAAHWTDGWYGIGVAAKGDELLPGQNPAEYLRPAAEYELGLGYQPFEDPHYAGASFAETRSDYALYDVALSDSFNRAASGPDQAPSADETEDEKAGGHFAGPSGPSGPAR